MFTRSTFSVLMLVGLLAESGAASAQEYCVACSEPDAVYRCIIEGAQPGGAQPLQVMCITAMAKAGNHATCGVKRGTVFQCDGPVRRVPWTASGESQPLNPQAQKSDSKPSDPNEPPKTMLEMADRANKKTADDMKKAGESVSDGAKKTWECIASLFFKC